MAEVVGEICIETLFSTGEGAENLIFLVVGCGADLVQG
jgi:hypothetical protein